MSTFALATPKSASQLFGEALGVDVFGVDASQQKLIDQQLRTEMGLLEHLGTELNQLNNLGVVNRPSAYLLEFLALCDKWEKKTELAFSCKLGGFQTDWLQAVEKKELPDRSELRKKSRAFLQQGWVVSASDVALTTAAKNSGFKISTEGLLQAFVVDKLVTNLTSFATRQTINVQGVALRFDNQQRCWSKAANNHTCTFNKSGKFLSSPLAMIVPAPGAVVMIDSREQSQKIGSYTLSKIITPKGGWPVEFAPSVMVVAADAVTATVAARSLVVKPIATGIQWINAQSDSEALVMTDSGSVFPSKGWYSLLIPDAQHKPLWSGEKQFLIEYQTLEHQVAEYRRPYAALWITNSDRQLIRQLVVHGNNLRWLKEIPLWWRRHGRNDEQAVDGLARATTAPGSHMLVWDGRDDQGNKVQKGHYVLNIEAAREHGEHEMVSVPFELSGQSFSVRAAGEKELGVIKVSFNSQP